MMDGNKAAMLRIIDEIDKLVIEFRESNRGKFPTNIIMSRDKLDEIQENMHPKYEYYVPSAYAVDPSTTPDKIRGMAISILESYLIKKHMEVL